MAESAPVAEASATVVPPRDAARATAANIAALLSAARVRDARTKRLNELFAEGTPLAAALDVIDSEERNPNDR
jgi:hypothetical protein